MTLRSTAQTLTRSAQERASLTLPAPPKSGSLHGMPPRRSLAQTCQLPRRNKMKSEIDQHTKKKIPKTSWAAFGRPCRGRPTMFTPRAYCTLTESPTQLEGQPSPAAAHFPLPGSASFLFLYFLKSFFTEIYFRFHNLQFCTPTAGRRGGYPAANWRGGRDLNVNKIYF